MPLTERQYMSRHPIKRDLVKTAQLHVAYTWLHMKLCIKSCPLRLFRETEKIYKRKKKVRGK